MTWGRWERIRALQNQAFYITSTPPPGQNRQPPLTLFDFDQLLLGIERVPYVDRVPILVFDGPAFEVRNLNVDVPVLRNLSVDVPVFVVPASVSSSLAPLDQISVFSALSENSNAVNNADLPSLVD